MVSEVKKWFENRYYGSDKYVRDRLRMSDSTNKLLEKQGWDIV